MLNRRQFLLTGTLAVPGALAVGVHPAAAEPQATDPEVGYWLDWIAEHRRTVALVADDGSGATIEHRARQSHVLASTIKIVHLAAYATAVAKGRLDPDEQIRVGDWDARHPFVADGGAHRAALTAIGIPCNEYGIADDPEQTTSLDLMAATMIDFSDNAATDYLRDRLGDGALRRAAAAGGWHCPDVRSLQGEVLQLILPEYAAPTGSPAAVRRVIGDHLAARFIRQPSFREEVFDRIPQMPSTTEEQWSWTKGHGRGTAAELAGMHRAVAAGSFRPRSALPRIQRHLERSLADRLPEGALGLGFKGGSLPKTLSLGLNVRWEDGRTGVLALLLSNVSDDDLAKAVGCLTLGIEALTMPDRFAQLTEAAHG